MAKPKSANPNEPVIENRKARHDYFIEETLEVGLKLRGSEVKSVRAGQVSLAEGYVKAEEEPPSLTLYGVHIAEYAPAGAAYQHNPGAARTLLAHKREIRKLAQAVRAKGATIVPLKIYFVRGRAKLLIGLGVGKQRGDKRQDIKKREAKREIDRAMSRNHRG